MISMLLTALLVQAEVPPPNPNIDYPAFQRLAADVRPERAKRRITLAKFQEMARSGQAVILDARSADAFAAGHIEGAINLPLTDFTAPALAAALPDPGRPVLIYCNNNFANDRPPVPMKRAAVSLNIQTFINLAAYGYRNVFELGETVDFDDPAVRWVKAQPR